MSQHPDHESWDSTEWQAANPLPDIEQTGISIPNDHVAPEEDMTSPFTCSKEPTKGDWDRLKPEIEVLYTKHKLKEIMAIMRQKYNLRASEKMYKDRRSEWAISKNIKSQEKEAIVRKTAQRRQAGKSSCFLLRGTWVPDAKIKRYRGKKKIQSEQQAMASRARTPPELICFTPLASPMTTPRELEIPERLVKVVHEYINSSFDSKSWLGDDVGWCRHKKGLVKNGSINAPGIFANALKNAVYLLFSGKSGLAWQSFQIAMSYIVEIVSLEEPQTVFTLVGVVLSLSIDFGLPDIGLAVINQFHNVSTKLMGEMHPLSQSSGLVKQLAASNNMEALLILYQMGIDDFIWRVGRSSRDTVEFQLCQIDWSSEFQHAFDSIGKLQALLKTLRDVGSVSESCFRMHMQLAIELRVARRTQEALEVCESVTKLASDEEGAGSSAWSLMEALRQMSKCHEQLGDFVSAEQSIRQCINIGGTRYGFEHEWVWSLIARHESLLGKCHALDEARQAGEYLETVVSGKYERLRREEEEEWQRFQASEEGEKLQRSSE